MNTDIRYPIAEWRYEVANGDTVLGYSEWLLHRQEAGEPLYAVLPRSTLLPPGLYYVGDPCYVMQPDEWANILQATGFFNLYEDEESDHLNPKHLQHGVFSRNGTLFAVSSTAYGDGEYPCMDPEGRIVGSCAVDAGLIAAIPLEMIDLAAVESQYTKGIAGLGVVVRMTEEFGIEYFEGHIHFGDYSVITDGCGIEDEMDYYDYEEDAS